LIKKNLLAAKYKYNEEKMINFIGLGKLGLPAALFFASRGFRISGFDKNKDLVSKLKDNNFNINENRSHKYLKYIKRIKFNDDLQASLKYSSLSIITVPTPSKKDNSFSNEYILSVLEEIGLFIKKLKKNKRPYLITIASTVSPGSFKNIFIPFMRRKFKLHINKDFYFSYNPYFVALGNCFDVFENPDFLLLGCSSSGAKKKILNIYRKIYKNKKLYCLMSLEESELVKLLVNSFVTTKISYTNFITDLCNKSHIQSAKNILNTVGLDRRIGRHAFKMGGPFDGPCFPRDNQALINYCKKSKVNHELLDATIKVNNDRISDIKSSVKIFQKHKIKKIGFLGISYKSNTNCLDGANTINLIKYYIKKNIKIYYYDLYVENLKLRGAVRCNSLIELSENVDLVYVSYVDTAFHGIIKFAKFLKIWDIWGFLKSNNSKNISNNLLDLL
jgi:UDPglucose 6-dehydrogenase